jgi:hypothetical protein
MVIRIFLALALIVGVSPRLAAQASSGSRAAKPYFMAGVQAGYNSGLAFDLYTQAAGFSRTLPVRARFAFRYASVDPGIAVDARRIFINDNTNGTPEQRGRTWGFKLDLLYPVRIFSLAHAFAYGGVRHARFSGNYRFVGGNEDFDIRSSNWGVGGGLESHYRVSPRVDLVVSTGLDYFFASGLSGHDTVYNPGGNNVNPRADYTYADADAAIGQPKLGGILMLGVNYRL